MPECIIRCEGVVKRFEQCRALDGLAFNVEAGEVFALIGPNGSGKTTTVRILLGIFRRDEGDVSVFGLDPGNCFGQIGARLGVMLEHPGLHDQLSGVEYLKLYAGLFCLPPSEIPARIAHAFDVVGLSDRVRDRLGTLSKGMRQRISLARCLLNRPPLLILDEPFDGIDAESRRNLVEALPELARSQGTTIFVTSHNLSELERIATRVAILDHGRIARVDTLDALCAPTPGSELLTITVRERPNIGSELAAFMPTARWDPRQRRITVDLRTSSQTQDQILQELLVRGFSVEAFKIERQTLEDVYFSLTSKDKNR